MEDKCFYVGQRIRELREKAGMTQESLAKMAFLNVSYFSQIETGKANLTIRTLEAIANALGTKVNTFFSFEDKNLYDLEYIMGLLPKLPPEKLQAVGKIVETIVF